MLAGRDATAVVATTNAGRARLFYGTTLALPFVEDDGYALVFDCGGTSLRVARVDELTPQPFTVFGWWVEDLDGTMRSLRGSGVRFERYDHLEQDEAGVWSAPDGTRVAWFSDPDGNVLSIRQVGRA